MESHRSLFDDDSSSSSSLVGTSNGWTPNLILNNNNLNPNSNGVLYNSRDILGQENAILVQNSSLSSLSSLSSFISQIKEEEITSSDSFPKFTEMLNPNSFISNDLSEKLLQAEEFYTRNSSGFDSNSMPASRGNFSQIYPSVYISNSNQSNPRTSSFTYNHAAFGLDLMQPQNHLPSSNPSKIPSFSNGVTEAKRAASELPEPRTSQAAAKRSRFVSNASCPPFKVRKEKLGDRIAALQQLVAPFGKTDTASVLMEAIGYIKFLQNQIETLSVPYMKSSYKCRTTQVKPFEENRDTEELTRDLRSRGLCLVPLSCMSYITTAGDGVGGGTWPNA